MKTCFYLVLSLLLTGLTACTKNEPAPAPVATAPHKHQHQPPHGGTPVVLGQENFHLELVRDADAGTLTVHVLDRHMENIVRLEAPQIELIANVNGTAQTLGLRAVTNPLSNETVGDTSEFAAQADWLKTTAAFDAIIPSLTIRTLKFEQVRFQFPQGNDND